MTAVRSGESVRYAARLFLAWAAATILGGGLVGVGLAVGWPGVLGSGQVASAIGAAGGGVVYTAAGGVIVLVGVCVLAVGYLAVGYKLVSDAVANGVGRALAVAGDADAVAEATSVPGLDGSGGDARQSAETDDGTTGSPDVEEARRTTGDPSPEPTTAGGSSPAEPVADPAGTAASGQPPDPPEMTPEEIAFGSSSESDEPDESVEAEPGEEGDSADESFEDRTFDDERIEDETVEETEDVSNVTPAGSSASSDPLADPTEDD